MSDYKCLGEVESKAVHDTLLREPDETMLLFAKRLLGSNNKVSLPISFELLLMDKSPKQIIKELLIYYCTNSVIQHELTQAKPLKRKSVASAPQKKAKKMIKRQILS